MSYEFDDMENREWAGLGQWLTIAAILSGVYAVVNLVVGLLDENYTVIPSTVGSAILLFMLLRARGACNAVIDTQGDDVAHAMTALDALKVYFWVQAILFIVAIALVFLAVFLAFAVGFSLMR